MLAELVKQFHQLEEEIVLAISSDNEEAVYRLDERLELTRQRIAALHFSDPLQRKRQIEFLLGLVLAGNEQLQETSAFRDVQQLLDSYLNDRQVPHHADREQLLSRHVDNVSGNPVELAEFLGGECSDDLFGSNMRISIIGTDNTYRHTSCGNARFYDRKPNDIVNRHVGDLIGAERFERRARSYLEQCYLGKSLEYYHLLDHREDPGDTSIMRCEMIPHRPSGGEVRGAVVIMRDITIECSRPERLELTGLN